MITKEELLKGRDQQFPNDYTEEVSDNLDLLLVALNKIRDAYGIPMVINSGWRPPSINAKTSSAAQHSKHLIGLAADVADADGKLWIWTLENLELMKELNIYMEDKRWTPSWTHFQLGPPASGKRIFIPSSSPPLAPDVWDGNYQEP